MNQDSPYNAGEMASKNVTPDNPAARTARKMWIVWTALAVSIITLTVVLILMLHEEGYSTSEGATILTESQSPHDPVSPLKKNKESSKLTYGQWTGEIKFGQPHGQGTLTYSQQRLVSQFDPDANVANPGDYIIGDFDCGQLISGRLYRTSGKVIDIVVKLPGGED